VLSGSNDARRLERHSDIVYPNISVLLDDNLLFSSN